MIAKHIPINSLHKSSFTKLVNYIIDPQNKTERVGFVRATNCYSDQPDCAVAEVLNTQQMNQRATSDKTYHLVVSFRDDELPESLLQKVENQLCDGLGFGEHQRISVVHHDTDHLHIHIAINKIHPVRLTIHNPHYDYKVIGELCEKLEQEYGLTPDNHESRKRGAQGREANIKFKAGSESLTGWMQQECLEQILSVTSWTELHQVLTDHGIELRERGNGFVFVSSNGVGVKASSVDRSLSKASLIKKYGAYVKNDRDPDISSKPNDSKHYEKKPQRGKRDTSQLYAQYTKAQNDAAVQGKDDWIRLRNKKNKAIDSVMANAKFRLLVIKNLTAGRLSKKIMYAAANQKRKSQLDAVKEDYKQAYQASKIKHRKMDWLSWLVKESQQGNKEALEILRSRKNCKKPENSFSGTQANTGSNSVKNNDFIETITRTGTVIYKIGSTAIRDGGDRLVVLGGTAKDKVLEVLKEAIKRFGNQLTINGSDAFREKVVQVAVGEHLDVAFHDEALEQRRRDVTNQGKSKESEGGRETDQVQGTQSLKPKTLKARNHPAGKGQSR